jgi:hypothetical protein
MRSTTLSPMSGTKPQGGKEHRQFQTLNEWREAEGCAGVGGKKGQHLAQLCQAGLVSDTLQAPPVAILSSSLRV